MSATPIASSHYHRIGIMMLHANFTVRTPHASRSICRHLVIGLFVSMASAQVGAAQSASIEGPPLTLRALFDTVAATHPLIRASQARVRAEQGRRITAETLGNPVVSVQVDNTSFPGRYPIPGLDRETMVMATFPVEALYQRGPHVREADGMTRAVEADAATMRQRTAMDAADAFYRAALAQIGVATARDLLAWLDTVVAYNRARVAEGVASEADLIRSELERDRAASDATMQEAYLARARATLSVFLGDPRRTGTLATVGAGDVPFALPNTSESAATAKGVLSRPDVRAARGRLDASQAAVTMERTLVLRQLGATIGTKQMSGTTSMIAGLSLPLPLFDVNRGQMQRASAERDAAALELTAQERVASADVLGAHEAARLLTGRATVLTTGGSKSFLARADEARRIALGAYREGAIPLYQVLDAARAWGDARLTFYRTLYAQHESVLALLVAQGVDLLSNLPAAATPGASNR